MENEMDKSDSSYRQWYAALCVVAEQKGGSAADEDAWLSDYDDGKTPEQAWADEWGE